MGILDKVTSEKVGTDDAGDIGALFLDALSGVPVGSFFNRAHRIASSVRSGVDQERISKFLQNLDQTTPEQRYAFMKRYPEEKRRVHAFNILIKITETDDVRKAAVIARIFEAMVLSDLSEDIADRMIEAVRRSFWSDLVDLAKYDVERVFPVEDNPGEALVMVGLVYQTEEDSGDLGRANATKTYRITELGRRVVEYGNPRLES